MPDAGVLKLRFCVGQGRNHNPKRKRGTNHGQPSLACDLGYQYNPPSKLARWQQTNL